MFFFFFNDTATTEIYTLSLHDALPIYLVSDALRDLAPGGQPLRLEQLREVVEDRSEEHTSELQSRLHLVCRLLLEKKKLQAGFSSQPVRKSGQPTWLNFASAAAAPSSC